MNLHQQMHGKGVCVYNNGNLFEGYFFEGKRHSGRFIARDSYTFAGKWKDGRMDGPGIEVSIEGFSSDAFYRDGERIDDTGKPDGYKMLYEEELEGYVRLSQLITDPPLNKEGPHNFVFPFDYQFSFSNYIKVIYNSGSYHSFSTADGTSDKLFLC
jgi:hypothetical protein